MPAPAVQATAPFERVGAGLLGAVLGVVLGIVVTAGLAMAGVIAAVSSLVGAIAAVFLYAKFAGAPPRKGIVPLVMVIMVGLVASYFAVLAVDLGKVYDLVAPANARMGKLDFIGQSLFTPDAMHLLGTKDTAFFVLFGALGTFGTISRLVKTSAR